MWVMFLYTHILNRYIFFCYKKSDQIAIKANHDSASNISLEDREREKKK